MTTSGSQNFSMTRNDIIRRALRIVGVVPQGDEPTAEQMIEANFALNSMVKAMMDDGIKLWAADWQYKVFAALSSKVRTGNGTTDAYRYFICIQAHTSTTGPDTTTRPPSTNSAGGSAWPTYWMEDTTLTSVVTDWATETSYTTTCQFTPATGTNTIERAFIRYNSLDVPLGLATHSSFNLAITRSATGTPEILWFNRKLDTPVAHLWPIPDNLLMVVHYFRTRVLEDFDAAANTPDFPASWLDALTYCLAANLADEYQIPVAEKQLLETKSKQMLAKAQMANQEVIGRNTTGIVGRRGNSTDGNQQ